MEKGWAGPGSVKGSELMRVGQKKILVSLSREVSSWRYIESKKESCTKKLTITKTNGLGCRSLLWKPNSTQKQPQYKIHGQQTQTSTPNPFKTKKYRRERERARERDIEVERDHKTRTTQ